MNLESIKAYLDAQIDANNKIEKLNKDELDFLCIDCGVVTPHLENAVRQVSRAMKWEEVFANPGTIDGYLLEFRNDDGSFSPVEFALLTDPFWDSWAEAHKRNGDSEVDGIQVGFFRELGDSWQSECNSWSDRLGVDFCEQTPTDDPHSCGIWGGFSEEQGKLYRVSRITISAEVSDKAKEFIRKHPAFSCPAFESRFN